MPADIKMTIGNRYTFAALDGTPTLLHSTDGAGETSIFNNNVTIKDTNGTGKGCLTIHTTQDQSSNGPQLRLVQGGDGNTGIHFDQLSGGTHTSDWSIGIDSSEGTEFRWNSATALSGTNADAEMMLSTGGVLTLRSTITAGGDIGATGDLYANGTKIECSGKETIRFSDSWLRLNPDNDFSSGIYCGTGVLRTDGEFQVGSSGSSLKVTSTGLENVVIKSGHDINMTGASQIYKTEDNADGANTTPIIYTSAKHEEVCWFGVGSDREDYTDQRALNGYHTSDNAYTIVTYNGSNWRWSKWNDDGTVSSDHGMTSDQRLKTNVVTLTGSLDKIKQLRGVSFDWIDNNKSSMGFIAQEVEPILPTAVRDSGTVADGPLTVTGSDGEEYPTCRYGSKNDGFNNPDDSTDTNWGRGSMKVISMNQIIPILTEAMKEQQVMIDNLTARIVALENA